MFEKIVAPYVKEISPRLSPKLNYYVRNLEGRRNIAFKRHDEFMGYDTRGMELIKKIYLDAHVDELLSITDPIDRYINGIFPMLDSLTRIFDPTVIGVHNFGSFIQSPIGKGVDYIIPVKPDRVLEMYPFGEGWDAWQTVSALTLLDCDSNELTFKAYQDVLSFSKDKPDYALFALDVALLVLQRTVYLSTVPVEEQISEMDFIHKYVIYPCLIFDYPKIWLLNQYNNVLAGVSLDEGIKTELTSVYGMYGSQFDAFYLQIEKMRDDVTKGALKPDVMLSSLPLMDEESVSGYYKRIVATDGISPLRQYRWSEFLRDYKVLKIIIGVANLNPDFPKFSTFHSYLKRDFQYLAMSHPWTDLHNTKLRDVVKDRLDTLSPLITET